MRIKVLRLFARDDFVRRANVDKEFYFWCGDCRKSNPAESLVVEGQLLDERDCPGCGKKMEKVEGRSAHASPGDET